jgi:hypothetical protein
MKGSPQYFSKKNKTKSQQADEGEPTVLFKKYMEKNLTTPMKGSPRYHFKKNKTNPTTPMKGSPRYYLKNIWKKISSRR